MALDPREMLARMLLMRRFEETVIHVARAYKLGRQHLAIGNEAVGAAALMQFADGDLIYTTHRNHGHMIARGVDPGRALAEILGREGGLCGGRGGTWHMTDPSKGFQSTSAMVGGSIGLSVGGGFALKHKGQGRSERNVAVALFGDGALDEGIAYEALNIASYYQLPVLFLCENNYYAMGTALSRSESDTDLCEKARSYRVQAYSVDGMDVLAVMDVTARAAANARAGGGPQFIEFRTYRFRAHSMFDAELYRAKAEVEEWRSRCPIQGFQLRLRNDGLLADAELAAIEARIADEIDSAVAFAEAGTLEPIENLKRHVYTGRVE